jgi:hypothetical protein
MKKYAITLLLLLLSCNPFAVEPHTVYIIEEGQHYAEKTKNKISPVIGDRLHFGMVFNRSHVYNNGSDDINKLYGITSAKIHQHSARFGWRYKDDKIEIFAYYYIDGVRHFEKLGEAELNTAYEFIVDVTGYWYYFNFNGNELRVYSHYNITAFRSFPYFGGDLPAPHRMTFRIVEL